MWLFTTTGFYSVVTAEEFGHELQVRARSADDLDRLRDSFLPTLGPSVSKPGRDYPWRAFVTRPDFATCLSEVAKAIDYSNFKNAVAHSQGYAKSTDLPPSLERLSTDRGHSRNDQTISWGCRERQPSRTCEQRYQGTGLLPPRSARRGRVAAQRQAPLWGRDFQSAAGSTTS